MITSSFKLQPRISPFKDLIISWNFRLKLQVNWNRKIEALDFLSLIICQIDLLSHWIKAKRNLIGMSNITNQTMRSRRSFKSKTTFIFWNTAHSGKLTVKTRFCEAFRKVFIFYIPQERPKLLNVIGFWTFWGNHKKDTNFQVVIISILGIYLSLLWVAKQPLPDI